MTTQGVEITVGNSMMSKVFTDTSTDGQWSGNVLTDSIAGQSLGILIPIVAKSVVKLIRKPVILPANRMLKSAGLDVKV